jgi:CMP-N,N'-diacetyllegionaminic acid synthase
MIELDLSILIPARSGSKRVPRKNVHILGGRTLLEISVTTALQVAGPGRVYVSTDSIEFAELARQYGADVPKLRPSDLALDTSLDVEWMLQSIADWKISTEFVSILRPTSPFVSPQSLALAATKLAENLDFDSIRAIRKSTEHPGKMWRFTGSGEMVPLFPQILGVTPSHSRPTQSLEPIYLQCGAFEVARRSSVLRTNSIAGSRVLGYELAFPESMDINSPEDLREAQLFIDGMEGPK